jgi:integrase/recombinase XerD
MAARHLDWMKAQNYSRESIEVRESYLRRFAEWCEERSVTRLVEVTPSLLEDFKRYVSRYRKADGQPLKRATQAQALSNILAWTKWATRRGLLLSNPGTLLELPRHERGLPPPALTSSEVEQVLGAIDVSAPLGLRDRAILELAYSTGMRRMEIARLLLSDIDGERGTIHVREGKGRKDRVVPVGTRALAWLEKYVEEVRAFQVVEPDDGAVFLTQVGMRLGVQGMTHMGRRRREEAGVKKLGSMHIYRHSAATGMLEGGADVRVIQEYLGHASLNTTQIYTRMTIANVKAVHARTHPAERPRATEATEPGPSPTAPTAPPAAPAAPVPPSSPSPSPSPSSPSRRSRPKRR